MWEASEKQPTWTSQQLNVLNEAPNLIVSGCAGSGKTLLACHIAIEHAVHKEVAIIVYTKTLKLFIEKYIKTICQNKIQVFYEYEWQRKSDRQFDIIIIDEFQDFSESDIIKVITSTKEGVYILGDEEQTIYSGKIKKCISLGALILLTGFKHIHLSENFRLSEENEKFVDCIYKDRFTNSSAEVKSVKPRVACFQSPEDELEAIAKFLQTNQNYSNVGILLKQNGTFKGCYPYKGTVRKTTVYGIKGVHDFLQLKGIKNGWKDSFNDNLDFSQEKNINIMTYHSAKGLQFDCVILPFSTYVNENNGASNLPYVGLTRASKKIIITYTDLIADEYNSKISLDLFDGAIVGKRKTDELSAYLRLAYLTFEKNNFDWNRAKEVGLIDISDCEVQRI